MIGCVQRQAPPRGKLKRASNNSSDQLVNAKEHRTPHTLRSISSDAQHRSAPLAHAAQREHHSDHHQIHTPAAFSSPQAGIESKKTNPPSIWGEGTASTPVPTGTFTATLLVAAVGRAGTCVPIVVTATPRREAGVGWRRAKAPQIHPTQFIPHLLVAGGVEGAHRSARQEQQSR